MIRILALVAATIPVLTVESWGKYNVFELKSTTEYVTKLCKRNLAEDKVPQVLDAIENFEDCSVSLFKEEVFLDEVAVAIRSNDLNGVYKKYCARTPRLANCTYTLIDSIGLCVTGANLTAAHNFIDQLLSFVCHNDSERVGVFIKEGGPQCFHQNAVNLNSCGIKAFAELDAIPPQERCNRFDNLSTCVVDTLKTCSVLTPANMMLDLFGHLRQATPCPANDHVFRSLHGMILDSSYFEGRVNLNKLYQL